MKYSLMLLTALFLFASTAQADIIWSEDFSGYADGDSVNGMGTATGDGTLNTVNSVAVDANGNLVHDANAGTERTWISSETDVLCGCFGFDLAVTGTPDNQDAIFVQLAEGPIYSTGGSPEPNFNFTLDVSNSGVSTDAMDLSSVKIFFNVSGEDYTFTAPDGSTRTLATGTRTYYVDGNLIGTGSNSAHSAGAPSAVNTLAFATFNNQSGQQFHFDNFSLDRFTHAVPEPSSLAILGALGLLALGRRRK